MCVEDLELSGEAVLVVHDAVETPEDVCLGVVHKLHLANTLGILVVAVEVFGAGVADELLGELFEVGGGLFEVAPGRDVGVFF